MQIQLIFKCTYTYKKPQYGISTNVSRKFSTIICRTKILFHGICEQVKCASFCFIGCHLGICSSNSQGSQSLVCVAFKEKRRKRLAGSTRRHPQGTAVGADQKGGTRNFLFVVCKLVSTYYSSTCYASSSAVMYIHCLVTGGVDQNG